MPTIKHRINLSPSREIDILLRKFASREKSSVAAVALGLIHKALEIDEDGYLLSIVQKREKQGGRWVSHERAWK